MWNTETVNLQTVTEVNTLGSIKQTWTNSTAILCDVQDISKEYAYKKYGLTDANEMRQIFAPTGSLFVVGNQVSYNSLQWLVRLVNDSHNKIGASNHCFAIVSKVI